MSSLQSVAGVVGMTVPALVLGGVGGLGAWWFSNELVLTLSDSKTAWVLPVGGTLLGMGLGFWLSANGFVKL